MSGGGETFRVGLTRDFLKPGGMPGFGDIGLDLLDAAPGVAWEYLAEDTRELRPDQVRGYDALIVLVPRVTAATLAGADRLALVARFGVGYDSIDTDACTARGVALTIAPDGVRRPVAVAVLTYLLALSQRLFAKDRLTRTGRWDAKLDYMGQGVTGRTLGVIGVGNIGREIFALARPFGLRLLATDPYVTPGQVAELGGELVGLETLLRQSDYVSVNCPLTPDTYHLINADRLALMKPTAYLINTARGPIVDQLALTTALRARRIRGAALDVFEREPVDPADPILQLDNVIVAPHGLAWTDEWTLLTGRSCCENILAVAAGREPDHVVNRAVLQSPQFREKLRRYAT